jgi:thioredoxin-dependent peroxiredoxin
MTLTIGDLAPDFTLLNGTGQSVTLSGLRGKRVILYFYPKDNTPGCTKEACGFRDAYPGFLSQNVVVLGVSPDSATAHQKFIAKFDLPFPLLCDPDNQVAQAYESYGLKKFMGKEYMGVLRQTFVIDAAGHLERIYRKVKAETHAAELLEDLLG